MYLLIHWLPLPACKLMEGGDTPPSALLFPRAQSSGWYLGMCDQLAGSQPGKAGPGPKAISGEPK